MRVILFININIINIANHVDYSIYDFFQYIYINLKKFSTLLKRILHNIFNF